MGIDDGSNVIPIRRVMRRRHLPVVSLDRLSRATIAEMRRDDLPDDGLPQRPKTRAECGDGPRPCPFVSCRHHLLLDVSEKTGAIKMRFADLESMPETCAIDVAEQGGATLDEIGKAINVTRERARQLIESGLASVRKMRRLDEHR